MAINDTQTQHTDVADHRTCDVLRGRQAARAIGFALSMVAVGAVAAPAQAQDNARLQQLEQRLEQSLLLIHAMQTEIAELKATQQVAPSGDAVHTALAAQAERLDQVEESVVSIEDRVGSRAVANAFDAMSLDIGGFLHQTFTYADGDDGSSASFNKTTFELLLKAQLTDDWSAFMAQAFSRESADPFSPAAGGTRKNPNFDTSGGSGAETVIAWADYRFSDAASLRFGRLLTPQGIVNIEHFPAILLDPEQPQFLRPFGSDTLFANFLTGVELHGSRFIGDDRLTYSAFTGNFSENGDKLNYGGRGAYTFGNSGISVGLNYNGGERRPAAGGNFDVFGVDLKIDRGRFLLTGEAFASNETSALRGNRTAWYIQPAFRLDADARWTAFYRFDFLDDGGNEGDSVENVFGLSFKAANNVHLRASYTLKDFDRGVSQPEANAGLLQVSGTLSF